YRNLRIENILTNTVTNETYLTSFVNCKFLAKDLYPYADCKGLDKKILPPELLNPKSQQSTGQAFVIGKFLTWSLGILLCQLINVDSSSLMTSQYEWKREPQYLIQNRNKDDLKMPEVDQIIKECLRKEHQYRIDLNDLWQMLWILGIIIIIIN